MINVKKRNQFSFGPSVGPARGAAGVFPYPARTIEEIDIDWEDLREHCLLSERGRGKW